MSEDRFDVFISYSHEDTKWVREILLPRIEHEGFSVIIDFRDFQTGAFGVMEMERAIIESRKTLLVMTGSYMQSEWGKLENIMAQTVDPGAVQKRIIPILKEDCTIPLRLKIIHYRDLRNDDPVEWDLLIRDLI